MNIMYEYTYDESIDWIFEFIKRIEWWWLCSNDVWFDEDGWLNRYDEIKQRFPEEYMKRERNKLEYRYPDGESYIDVKDRLSQILMKIVGCRDSVLIVGHVVWFSSWLLV